MRLLKLFVLILSLGLLSARAQHGADAARASLAGLELADGLHAELFASDPLLVNPVAFSIDEQGRFFIAESHRWKDSIFDLWTKDDRWKLADFSFTRVEQREAFLRAEFATNISFLTKDSEIIRLVEDKDGDGVAESSSIFAEQFNLVTSGTAAGILASQGELWFTCIPDLWKFEYDSNGKATSDEILHTGYGVRTSVSGHDLHGLTRGPDGRIYFSVGDRGANVLSKEGTRLENANCGAVFRCEPDGSNLELFATGLRNPQDLAFDEFGNLWTHDNDTSGDDPPRVLHVVEGGDYGWRQAYQFMPEFGPWVREKMWEGKLDDVLPPAGFGAQGPSGMAAYPGVGLPAKYKGALLACDFPQGVWAYFFKPNGATYELRKERFVWTLGPTDVDFGPDGHVYISDWGRSYAMPNAGRLLRIRSDQADPAAATLKQLLTGGIQGASAAELPNFLAHPDQRVRSTAQFELERRQEMSALALTAKEAVNQLARIHAIWALGNLGRKGADAAEALLPLANDPDPEIRAQAARQLSEIKMTEPVIGTLVKMLGDSSPRVQMFAALSLGHAPSSKKISPLLLELAARAAASEPFIRHAVVHSLTTLANHGAIQSAAQSDNPVLRRVAVLSLRRLKSAQLANFLDDGDLAVRRDAARAINDLGIAPAFPALARRLESVETDAQILLRAINANYRLGTAPAWQRVLRFATDSAAAESLRIDAIAALGSWTEPSPLDRVVGLWRPLEGARHPGPREQLIAAIPALLNDSKLSLAALECAEKLGLSEVQKPIANLVKNNDLPDAVRVRALKVLGQLGAANLAAAVDFALGGSSGALTAEAVSWLPHVAPEQAVALIEKILASGAGHRVQQSAIAALGKLQAPPAADLLRNLVQELAAGKLNPALQLEVMEAAKIPAPAKSSSTSLASLQWALAGGDAALGQKIFQERDALGCVRCHAIKGQGGIVGPDLAGIAARRDREHLLQSIVHPNAELVPGYETVSVTLKDGRNFAGNVTSETADQLTVLSPEDGPVTLAKSEIASRAKSLSAMPEGLDQLMSRHDLRNLIEYLATLK